MKALPQTINELSCVLNSLSKKQIAEWTSAVNLLIVEDEVVFIKRSERMPTHKGEIAFMGGYKVDQDNGLPILTAAREFREESSIDSTAIEYLGLLNPVMTARNRIIIPALGRLTIDKEELFKMVRSNGEWTELITVPISYLKRSSNWLAANWYATNHQGVVLFCPIEKNNYCSYCAVESVDHMLWGATARIVWESLNIIEKLIKGD